ncbi:MAG: ATP-grasp domain-containing protein, partial [Aquificota bacterium]|nr:ATP-grasp domain-containing protein [Aquificota bacterium]
FVVEELVDFEREVSVVGVRDDMGRVEVFPLTENLHREGILIHNRTVTLPEVEREVTSITKALMEDLNIVGLLAVEFFITGDGKVLINEIAPRPHNTGHYTLDGTYTSQFENLIRAICGLPLGSTRLKAPSGMVNILGLDLEDINLRDLLSTEGTKIYWYGKKKRPRRKMGHINVVGRTEREVGAKIRVLAEALYTRELRIG